MADLISQLVDRLVDQTFVGGRKTGDMVVDGVTATDITQVKTLLAAKLRAAAGGSQTLAQVLALGNNANGLKITNAADPTADQDVVTKKYFEDNPPPGGSSYLEYYAKMNASGTDNPTLNSELNELGGAAITWARTIAGEYQGSRAGGFPENRTLVFVTSGADPYQVQGKHLMPEDTIAIYGFDDTWTPSDGLTDVSVRIVILPA